MNIPDKYRDRYDRLAASHPWMREMRDEPELTVYNEASDDELFRCSYCHCKVYNIDMTEGDCGWGFTFCPQCGGEVYESDSRKIEAKLGEPTNGIGGETNGIADKITLPEGDAPSEFAEILMRLAADCSCMGDGIVRHFEPKDVQNDVDALMRVVERDYVSRETHSKAADIWQAASDEWRKRALKAEAERDELKKQLDTMRDVARDFRDERDEWKAKAESALHENPYVGLVRGKQWERTEMSDYYCGRCGWKVTDHDSYCPECGGALHKTSNKPDSKFDARKTAETPETDAAKGDIRDFDDSREKLEADCTAAWKSVERIVRSGGTPKERWTNSEFFKLLDRQAAITHSIDAWNIKRLEEERESLQDQVDDLQANLNRANDAFETARRALEEQIAELERECDDLHSRIEQWMNAAASYRDLWERADARRIEAECERDGLAIALKHSDAEREHYRNLNSELMGVFDEARHVVARHEKDEGLA